VSAVDPPKLPTELISRFRARDAVVAVIGLGYVGLPLSLLFVERGFHAIGFDIDLERVRALERGEPVLAHLEPGRIERAIASRRFSATGDFARLVEADAILITVPTPVNQRHEPDLGDVLRATRAIAKTLRPGQLVVLESTTYPGTTDGPVREILEGTGLVAGADFFLGFSPEREDPGNTCYSTASIPKVVAGVDPLSGDVAEALYAEVVERTVRVSSARVAEATKLSENVFRAVNIALANELKLVFDRMGIDVWEVLDAAATKPFGYSRFDPGPGWGGHCVPVDPFYLAWKAREVGAPTRFIELAGEINVAMPTFVIEKLEAALAERGTPLSGSRVLLLGVAYKKDIDDTRESPAFELIRKLTARGAALSYHDSHVPSLPPPRSCPELPRLVSVALSPELLAQADAVLLATNHSDVDYEFVRVHSRLIVDTRGVFRAPFPNVVKA
jgi:UDP-N-acetyl-D-glucosamine dehydrogenase